jgi:hypothetical protein
LAGIIRNQLQVLDVDLYSRFCVIEQKARSLLEYSQGGAHIFYTTHGYSHTSQVEQNYDWLLAIDDLSKFNKKELFCLLVATYFHDAFMIPKRPGDELRARQEHAVKAVEYLKTHCDAIGIDIHEASCVGEVIRGHHVQSLDEITPETVLGSDVVDQRKLAACLSVADICHADASRAPRIVAEYLDLDPESHWHWRRHLQIGGVARKNDDILVSGTIFSDDGEKTILAYCDEIRKQLNIVKPYFRSILLPVSDVKLLLTRSSSPVERPLSFQADMSKLLDLLINSVYSDRNVFIREIIQNSLDACRIRMASELQSKGYKPQIICTALYKERSTYPWGVRIDDNGVGMSINDFEDTVLWLGRSISSNEDIVELLQSGTMPPLIGVFGIGMMSCFGVAEEIMIASAKAGSQPFRVKIKSIFDQIMPSQDDDDSLGTTILIKFQNSVTISPRAVCDKYFWNINGPTIRVGDDLSAPEFLVPRKEVFKRYAHFELLKHNISLVPSENAEFFFAHRTNGVTLFLWHDSDDPIGREYIGDITVLSEGIYVCETKADRILPKSMAFLSGAIDLSAGKIDLAASRENFLQNQKYNSIRVEVDAMFAPVILELVRRSKVAHLENLHRYLLCEVYSRLESGERALFFDCIGEYDIETFSKQTEIKQCLTEEVVYLFQPEGRFVRPESEFNGDTFYKKRNDLQQMARYSLDAQGFVVVKARLLREQNDDDDSDYRVRDYKDDELIVGYLTHNGVEVVDISKEFVEEAALRSVPVSARVRRLVGHDIKFVDFGTKMNEASLCVQGTLYMNINSKIVRSLIEAIDAEINPSIAEHLARVVVLLHQYDFQKLEDYILRTIQTADAKRNS